MAEDRQLTWRPILNLDPICGLCGCNDSMVGRFVTRDGDIRDTKTQKWMCLACRLESKSTTDETEIIGFETFETVSADT